MDLYPVSVRLQPSGHFLSPVVSGIVHYQMNLATAIMPDQPLEEPPKCFTIKPFYGTEMPFGFRADHNGSDDSCLFSGGKTLHFVSHSPFSPMTTESP